MEKSELYKIVINTKTNEITKIDPIGWDIDTSEHCDILFYGYSKCFYIFPNREKYIVNIHKGGSYKKEKYEELKQLILNKIEN